MNTSVEERPDRRRRRRHSARFKAEVVSACRRPGVSIAALALSHGLNANLLRRWVVAAESESELRGAARALEPAQFVAIPFEQSQPAEEAAEQQSIRIEVQRAGVAIKVDWPISQAAACSSWLRDLLR